MPRLDPQKRRQQNTVDVPMGDGTTILVRRRSLPDLSAMGVLPLRLLRATDEIVARYDGMSQEDISQEVSERGSDEDADTAHDVRRRVVCACALDPIITMTNDGDPSHLPIDELDLNEQLALFTAITGPAALDTPVAVPELPDLSNEVAQRDFRTADASADADAVPAGKDISSATKRVARGRVDTKVAGKRRRVSARR